MPAIENPYLSHALRDLVLALLGTGMLSVLASLVLGLLIATAKSSDDSEDTNMRAYAADMIVLDGTLRLCGDEALAARRALRDYATEFFHNVWPDRPSSPYIVPSEQGLEMLQRV